MRALVLSGGSGLRCRPFTHSMPKQLIPIANKPVLHYVIENIRDLGITDIGLVVGLWEREIAESIGDGSRFGVRVTYLRQEAPLGLAHAVQVGRPFLGDDDFLLHLGDNFLAEGIAEVAADFAARRPPAQLLLHKVADPSSYGVAEVNADGSVRRLVEKPAQPRTDLAVVGVYFLTPDIHAAIDAIRPSSRGELEITDAIQWLIDHGARVTSREYGGFWKDVGRIGDILACNRRVLDGLRPAVRGQVDRESMLHGQVVVEDGARVLRSRVDGPVIIGAGTVVEDSWIGPGTSVGRDCVIHNSGIQESLLLDGAQITGVRGAGESLIGRRASIRRIAANTVAHRLMLGDDTTVEVP
ncbi:glucose-1-phosphate thymidylyltransferase [Micromonospora sp. NPDC048999]|uniref:glucose-1-phosphate thymidylyltransferase n=1 Tax=Micromonospora sp. NPDC048999 TaxID=3155391 RepID=UPI0034021A3A